MKGTEMFDAMAHIDEDLVERCLAGEKNEKAKDEAFTPDEGSYSGITIVEKPASTRKRIIMAVGSIAAVLLLVLGLVSILHIGGKTPVEPIHGTTKDPVTTEPAPTPEATPGPVTDADRLRAFFDTADENGVKNGDKLFSAYDRNDPSTWSNSGEGLRAQFVFDENGQLTAADLMGDEEAPVILAGDLDLSGFEALEQFTTCGVVFDGGVKAADMRTASHQKLSALRFNNVSGEALFRGGYSERLAMRSMTRTLVDMTGELEEASWIHPSFRIEVIVEGWGYAGVNAWSDENAYEVRLSAAPSGGESFIGWYDENGELVSSELTYELFGEASGRNCDDGSHSEFKFTAKFTGAASTPEPIEPPAEEWLLSQAWPYAQAANEALGISFEKEKATYSIGEEECVVNFASEDKVWLGVYFHVRNNTWKATGNIFWPMTEAYDPDLNYDNVPTSIETMFVTDAQLSAAGCDLSDSTACSLAAARIVADAVAANFGNAPENNVDHAIDAKAGEPRLYAIPLTGDRPTEIISTLYFRPLHLEAFLNFNMDIGCHIAAPGSEHPGWVAFDIPLNVSVSAAEGGVNCRCSYPSGAENNPGYIYPGEDAMSYVEYYAEEILRKGRANMGGDEGVWLIRFLYGMDWERFGMRFTVAQWEELAKLLRPCAVAQEGIDQLDMDLYVMLGCKNAPERFWQGLATLLDAQLAYDSEAFTQALSNLSHEDRAKVQEIMSRYVSDSHINLMVLESNFRQYASSSFFLAEEDYAQGTWFSGRTDHVYFSLESDGLKAYERKYVRSEYKPNGETETSVYYDGLLATFPKEAGQTANRLLVEHANSFIQWGAPADANMIDEGFLDPAAVRGEEAKWFALVTRDESIQDLQVHCIMYNDGGNWVEIPGNNGGLDLTICGVGVKSKDEVYISYFTKHLWDDTTGWTRPYVYRTTNGGRTYTKLDITLPDRFMPRYSDRVIYPLSAVFSGNHGVMVLHGFEDGEIHWLETRDGGATWTYKEL